MKTDLGISANQRSRARAMRGAPTDAELHLWRLLRDRRLNGFKFRRQVPVGRYIVDFLCLGSRLIVEADGSQHAESPRDQARDAYLEAKAGRCSGSGMQRSCSIERMCSKQYWRMRANPHPALRATFSPREKGWPFPLSGKVSPKATDEG
jgi:2-isopropylmalate synthase